MIMRVRLLRVNIPLLRTTAMFFTENHAFTLHRMYKVKLKAKYGFSAILAAVL